jgi:hypothetical protein
VWVEGRPPRVTITQGRWLRQPLARPNVGVIQRPVDVDVVNARALVLSASGRGPVLSQQQIKLRPHSSQHWSCNVYDAPKRSDRKIGLLVSRHTATRTVRHYMRGPCRAGPGAACIACLCTGPST